MIAVLMGPTTFPHSLPPPHAGGDGTHSLQRHPERHVDHQGDRRHEERTRSGNLEQNQERGRSHAQPHVNQRTSVSSSISSQPRGRPNFWQLTSASPFQPTTQSTPSQESYSVTGKSEVNGLHHNKLLIDNDNDPQPPSYEAEAIPPVVDSKGGIHFSDGAGGTFGLSQQLPGLLSHGNQDDKSAIILIKGPGSRGTTMSTKEKEKIETLTNVFREHFNPDRLPSLNPLVPPPIYSYRPPASRSRSNNNSHRGNHNSNQYIPVIEPMLANTRTSSPASGRDPLSLSSGREVGSRSRFLLHRLSSPPPPAARAGSGWPGC